MSAGGRRPKIKTNATSAAPASTATTQIDCCPSKFFTNLRSSIVCAQSWQSGLSGSERILSETLDWLVNTVASGPYPTFEPLALLSLIKQLPGARPYGLSVLGMILADQGDPTHLKEREERLWTTFPQVRAAL